MERSCSSCPDVLAMRDIIRFSSDSSWSAWSCSVEIRFSTERLMAIFNAAMDVLRSDTRGLLSLLSFANLSRLSTRLLYSLICASTVVLVNPEFAGISAPECAGFSRYSLMNLAIASWLFTSKDLALYSVDSSRYAAERDLMSVILCEDL